MRTVASTLEEDVSQLQLAGLWVAESCLIVLSKSNKAGTQGLGRNSPNEYVGASRLPCLHVSCTIAHGHNYLVPILGLPDPNHTHISWRRGRAFACAQAPQKAPPPPFTHTHTNTHTRSTALHIAHLDVFHSRQLAPTAGGELLCVKASIRACLIILRPASKSSHEKGVTGRETTAQVEKQRLFDGKGCSVRVCAVSTKKVAMSYGSHRKLAAASVGFQVQMGRPKEAAESQLLGSCDMQRAGATH